MINTPKKASAFVLVLFLYQILIANIFGVLLSFLPVQLDTGAQLVLSQILCFVIPCGIVILLNKQHIDDILPFRSPGAINCVMIVAMIMLIQPTMMLVSALSSIIFPNTISATVDDVLGGRGLGYTLLAVAMVPAICEEITFRGIIFSGYKRIGILAAALFNGFFFAMVHFSFQQFAYVFILGTIFCYFVRYTGSLWSSILAHFTLNASQTIYSYWASRVSEVGYYPEAEDSITFADGSTIVVQDVTEKFTYIFLAVIVLTTLALFIILFRAFLKRNRHIADESLQTSEAYNTEYTYPQDGMPSYNRQPAPLNEKKLVNWELIAAVVVYLLYMALIAAAEFLVQMYS